MTHPTLTMRAAPLLALAVSLAACSAPAPPAVDEEAPAAQGPEVSFQQEPNVLHIEIDDRCFKLLALHQPMAVDLRAIVAAVKINTDLERVGDLAVNIAQRAALAAVSGDLEAKQSSMRFESLFGAQSDVQL